MQKLANPIYMLRRKLQHNRVWTGGTNTFRNYFASKFGWIFAMDKICILKWFSPETVMQAGDLIMCLLDVNICLTKTLSHIPSPNVNIWLLSTDRRVSGRSRRLLRCLTDTIVSTFKCFDYIHHLHKCTIKQPFWYL